MVKILKALREPENLAIKHLELFALYTIIALPCLFHALKLELLYKLYLY